jgi:hypothetical protein
VGLEIGVGEAGSPEGCGKVTVVVGCKFGVGDKVVIDQKLRLLAVEGGTCF